MLSIYELKILSDLKNGGTCFDSDGTDEFSCTCELPFVGAECQTDLCENTVCQNDGTCDVKLIDGVLTLTCECPDNYIGDVCEHFLCSNDVPCYNGNTCDGQTCQCSQENGNAKYYGESCDMPAACEGNPCQNGGTCNSNTQADGSQVCFVIKYHFYTSIKSF